MPDLFHPLQGSLNKDECEHLLANCLQCLFQIPEGVNMVNFDCQPDRTWNQPEDIPLGIHEGVSSQV